MGESDSRGVEEKQSVADVCIELCSVLRSSGRVRDERATQRLLINKESVLPALQRRRCRPHR